MDVLADVPPTRLEEQPPIRVLVVEDDGKLGELLARSLGEAGMAVETAESGEDALRRCDFKRFDTIVLDLMLPGIDGLEVHRRLNASGSKAAIVILTARGDVARHDHPGVSDLFPKPFSLTELVARLRELGRG